MNFNLILAVSLALHSVAAEQPAGMVWISGGESTMGSDQPGSRKNEQFAHRVSLDGFWIDSHDVTNREVARFVEETGYVTTAERSVDWEELRKQLPPGTPRPAPEMLQPGSLVFTPSNRPVDLTLMQNFWQLDAWRELATIPRDRQVT
jgi:formylglycine-generating enzyme